MHNNLVYEKRKEIIAKLEKTNIKIIYDEKEINRKDRTIKKYALKKESSFCDIYEKPKFDFKYISISYFSYEWSTDDLNEDGKRVFEGNTLELYGFML